MGGGAWRGDGLYKLRTTSQILNMYSLYLYVIVSGNKYWFKPMIILGFLYQTHVAISILLNN